MINQPHLVDLRHQLCRIAGSQGDRKGTPLHFLFPYLVGAIARRCPLCPKPQPKNTPSNSGKEKKPSP